MSYVVADGKSNWLEGVILICEYHWQLFIVTSRQPTDRPLCYRGRFILVLPR